MAETSALLVDAYATAMRKLDAACEARREPWEQAARERLDAVMTAFAVTLDSVESGYRVWRDAARQVSLATDPRARRKSAGTVDVALDLRGGAEPARVSEVIAALRRLARDRAEDAAEAEAFASAT